VVVLHRAALSPAASAEAVLDHFGAGADIIVPIANGEPVTLLDAIEANAETLMGVNVHQMHALHDRPYLHGAYSAADGGHRLRHISYFLSHITRKAYREGGCDLVPNHFSEVPAILRSCTKDPLVLAAASPIDRHGYFSLGTSADYVANLIGHARFFLEVNPQMPRSFGRNQIHISQIEGWVEADYPLVEVEPAAISEIDQRIGAFIAERIRDGSTLQAGIGAIPNAVLSFLTDRRDLGLHTELLSDGVIDLVLQGVLTGTRKRLNPNKIVATFALGTRALYDFLHENPAVELWPVDYVNDPRVIAQEDDFVSVNATLEVDLLGQCASESLGSTYYSSSGGQSDFARGAMFSPGGQAFIVLRSTTTDGKTSRIKPQLTPGAAVTTLKNTVDNVVTEWGVAELRGRTIAARAKALIAVAHPDFRDELTDHATRLGFFR
jgi:acyl-CoA hydrolase